MLSGLLSVIRNKVTMWSLTELNVGKSYTVSYELVAVRRGSEVTWFKQVVFLVKFC